MVLPSIFFPMRMGCWCRYYRTKITGWIWAKSTSTTTDLASLWSRQWWLSDASDSGVAGGRRAWREAAHHEANHEAPASNRDGRRGHATWYNMTGGTVRVLNMSQSREDTHPKSHKINEDQNRAVQHVCKASLRPWSTTTRFGGVAPNYSSIIQSGNRASTFTPSKLIGQIWQQFLWIWICPLMEQSNQSTTQVCLEKGVQNLWLCKKTTDHPANTRVSKV